MLDVLVVPHTDKANHVAPSPSSKRADELPDGQPTIKNVDKT